VTAARHAAGQAASAAAWAVLTVAAMLTGYALVCLAIGWRPTVVTSGSMSPALRVGDVVVFAPATDRPPTKGMIVLFQRPGSQQQLAHRVVAVRPDGLVTKGDANAVPDSGLVAPDSIRGQARLVLPRVGVLRLLGTAHWHTGLRWLTLLAVAGALALLTGRGHRGGRFPTASDA